MSRRIMLSYVSLPVIFSYTIRMDNYTRVLRNYADKNKPFDIIKENKQIL